MKIRPLTQPEQLSFQLNKINPTIIQLVRAFHFY